MLLASHNSWSYLTPKKWWMKLLNFTAKCQDADIKTQYEKYDVRAFDLRVKFKGNTLIVNHNLIEYDITEDELNDTLKYLNSKKDVYVRVLLDVRSKKKFTMEQIDKFVYYCRFLENVYKHIKFYSGRTNYNGAQLYNFKYNPVCTELYASVTGLKIDDLYPRYYAKKNNHNILSKQYDSELLMIDFVNIR